MDAVEVHGLRIAYERTGAGPPLVLLHGYIGDGPSTWRRQLDDLADAFTVVAWDAPGAGASSDPPETFGLAGYAEALAGFLAALGLRRPHVAGLSFGGALALAFAHRYPTVPATLILASAYAGWGGSLAPEEAERRLRQAIELSRLSPADFADTLLPTMFAPGTPASAVAAFEDAVRRFHPAGFRAMARASAEDLRSVLPHVRTPSLLVYGERDVRAPLAVAEQLRSALPDATLVTLPDTGHVSTIEAPGVVQRRGAPLPRRATPPRAVAERR